MPEYELLLPFDVDSPEFVRGFEAGKLYARAAEDRTTWEQTIHASNAEMALRIAEATDRNVEARELDDCWMVVRFD